MPRRKPQPDDPALPERTARPGPLLATALAMLVGAFFAHTAQSVDRIVTTLDPGFDSEDGETSLEEAAAIANGGDRIIFADGLEGTIFTTGTLVLKASVGITGPAGLDITIDGGGTHRIIECGGFINEFENLVLTHGSTRYSFQGGAIYSDGNLWVNNCILIDNRTGPSASFGTHSGAAIYKDGGLLNVYNSIFYGNGFTDIEAVRGGAIAGYGTFTIESCTFEQNTIDPDESGTPTGSCIYFYDPDENSSLVHTCTIRSTLFVDNSIFDTNDEDADDGYGAVFNSGQKLVLDDCVFRRNTAFYGGAIVNGSPPGPGGMPKQPVNEISFCTFDHNTARFGRGGAIFSTSGTLEADFSVFIDNYASGHGGAVFSGGTCNLDTSFFRSNTSGASGGIVYVSGAESNLALYNSVAFNNQAHRGSGAVYCEGTGAIEHSTFLRNTSYPPTGEEADPGAINAKVSDKVRVGHCMIARNLFPPGAPETYGIDVSGRIGSLGYNLIEDPHELFAFLESDRIGEVPHIFAYPNGSLMLYADSPGINQGDPAITSLPLHPVDVYGNSRVAGGQIDIGGVEIRPAIERLEEWLAFFGVTAGTDDDDDDRLLNIVEALLGGVPISGRDASPIKVSGGGGGATATTTGAPDLIVPHGAGTASVVEVEFPIDERVTFLEGVLQTSPDMATWTDRVTYVPLGGGLGIQRASNGGGVSLLESTKTGYVWKMREAIEPGGGAVFARIDVREP